jgi:tetratricopeptide (TPR) repeat protein
VTTQELHDIVLRCTSEISEIRHQLADLTAKEKRAETAVHLLRTRLEERLGAFDRDRYKSTDDRLQIEALAAEILIFQRLGYELGVAGSQFILGVAALLEGRNLAALECFADFLKTAATNDPNHRNASYLAGMISYNRKDFTQAIEFYESAFRHSPPGNPDWQSKIYVGELLHLLRRSEEQIQRVFLEAEEALASAEDTLQNRFQRATLYLKLANCYVATFLDPKEPNVIVNNTTAIRYYKQARRVCPTLTESLLPVVIDYSLAQALILANSIDMDLRETPAELLADVFKRLRKIVLTKREEIILAQSFFMLGTCAVYSPTVSKDAAEIYLEYARHQTLTVPSTVCFYSCITKELLSREQFIWQIDHYASELERQTRRR